MSGLPGGFTRERGLHLLREMLRIRQFEDRCAELYGAGAHPRLPAPVRRRGSDRRRRHAGARARATRSCRPTASTATRSRAASRMGPLMAELYGKRAGCSGGRGGSMHIFDAATRFYGGNAIVGGGLPLAVGLALAEKLRGSRNRAACFFGEGAAAEGEFHESMNLAALWQLPVLFLCENNLYAMGTALARSESQTDIQAKAAAYGVRAAAVDGMDVFAVEAAVREAAEHARAGNGPVLLEMRTYRLRAHSMFDAQLYRDKAEVEEWRKRGPLTTLTTRLKAAGLHDGGRLPAPAARGRRRGARPPCEFAAAAEWEPVGDLARHVYAEAVTS